MPELLELIQALLNPKAYPHNPLKIELAQTQMSLVFLAGEYVFKIKKPVNLGYLDYTTLEKRHFYCQREVELNRRLCPAAYLEVVPIVRQKEGVFVGGKGEALEYAVKMRRLPPDAMMDSLLVKDRISPQMVVSIAEKLAAFHQNAETNLNICSFGDLYTICENTGENFDQTEKYIGNTISQEQHQRIKTYTNRFIAGNVLLFNKRMVDGRIRDCHGDLHAAHICFCEDLCIYDCIEFNDRFRYCDVASEVAFLAMDLDHYRRADLSQCFVDAYITHSQDNELRNLLDFYKCYRAYVRGKVTSFKLDDPIVPQEEKTQGLAIARSYFKLAESYTKKGN